MDLYLDQQAIDTTTPMGKLVFQLTGAFAQFERTMIRQRIKPGDLPVQQAVKIELAVNLQTAKALGVEMTLSLLLRINEVIE